jgi:hypothetical protein
MNTSGVNASNPVARVVTLLTAFKYLPAPTKIGGITFQFASILQGAASLDLVVIVDTAVGTSDRTIRSQIQGLAQALDLVQSRRSLTVVFVGPRPARELVGAVNGVARVLFADSPGPDDSEALERALAVLLPLQLTQDDEESEQSWAGRRADLLASHTEEITNIVTNARFGAEAVERVMRAYLSEPLETVYELPDDEGATDERRGP